MNISTKNDIIVSEMTIMTNINTLIENRFNHTGRLIFMATSIDNTPYIRAMTPYYHDGSFYFISSLLSEKIKHIESNNIVALCGEWFNAQGIAYITKLDDLSPALKQSIITSTQSWIILGNVDLDDNNTCIIQVKLTEGYIVENKEKYTFKNL